MRTTSPLVAIIHATPATFGPVETAFEQDFPGAELWHLLDDRLVKDADRAGGLTPQLRARMSTLIDYAVSAGADAVQLACSMYGPVATARADHVRVPVLAADQAMFDDVVARRPRGVVLLSSLLTAATDSADRLRASLAGLEPAPAVEAQVVAGAKEAAARGDDDSLARVMTEAVRGLGDDVDVVVVLAQYSLAKVVNDLRQVTALPVLSGPHLAASVLAERLEGTT